MRLNPKDTGDYNLWRREPICVPCGDTRRVTTRDTARLDEVVACPYCGDPEKYEKLRMDRFRLVNPPAEIDEADLTKEEAAVVKDWRNRGFHMADCLRWIEGRRYDPEKDEAFLAEARKAFKEWKRLSGRSK